MTFQLPPPSGAADPFAAPPLAVACPSCHGALAVAVELAGGAARCPLCAAGFRVPAPVPAEPAAASFAPDPAAPAEANWSAPPADVPGGPSAAVPAEQQPSRPRGELEFAEPVRTISSGDTVIELHRLSPREKAVRRARRNLVMLLLGVSILMAIVLIFGTKPRKRRQA